MGFEYHLNINRYAEMDLKTILEENPKLDLIQMKQITNILLNKNRNKI